MTTVTQLIQLFSVFVLGMTNPKNQSSTPTVLFLFFLLLALIILLIFLYKKLNRENNGEYTVQRMVYKEGGIRDQVRGAALALGTRLGVQLWPHSETEEYGSEMQEIQDEEGHVEKGDSQGSDSEEQCEGTEEKDSDTSDEESCGKCSEADEQTKLTDQPDREEKGEEKEEEVEGKASGGAGVLIDLKQFSGSAIWSEEKVSEFSDVTPL